MTGTEMMAPTLKRLRAYFAPVNRVAKQATLFDPAQAASFALDAPAAPWTDLGWIGGFERTSETAITAVRTGAPAATQSQARAVVGGSVRFTFESWGKLQLALASGSQQLNLLAVQHGAAAAPSGGLALPPVSLQPGSTATVLNVGEAAATAFPVGSVVAVDVDYIAGTTGFVGSGVSGAYVRAALKDVDYTRRVTLNVGRVMAVSAGMLMLEAPLIAGMPTAAMKVSRTLGFCDREGSTFFQEWSAVFVGEGQQGDRVIWHYPRLQTATGVREQLGEQRHGYAALRLLCEFRALPVVDAVDGEQVVCFRSYISA